MLSDQIIIAIITAIAAVIGSYFANIKTTREKNDMEIEKDAKRDAELADLKEQTDERFARIEKKLDEHNAYAQKFADIAVDLAKIQKDIEKLSDRVAKKN